MINGNGKIIVEAKRILEAFSQKKSFTYRNYFNIVKQYLYVLYKMGNKEFSNLYALIMNHINDCSLENQIIIKFIDFINRMNE